MKPVELKVGDLRWQECSFVCYNIHEKILPIKNFFCYHEAMHKLSNPVHQLLQSRKKTDKESSNQAGCPVVTMLGEHCSPTGVRNYLALFHNVQVLNESAVY